MRRGAIVVGAGPVGLMLAGEIRLGGADVVVYEKLPVPSGESRGVGFTRRAAEVFDQRGLLARLGEAESALGHFGGVRIDLGALEENHASVRGVAQSRTEAMLEGWLGELGVPVRRGYEVTGFHESADGVEVFFDGPDGPGSDTAEYLVGCDGGRSDIRMLGGFDFPGSEPTRGVFTADITGIKTRHRPIGEKVPGGMVMAMNLEDGVLRIVIYEEGLRPQDKGGLTFAEMADAWQRMTGEDIHHAQVHWVSAFTDAARQAAQYRRGRVFVAGDAAHIQLPAGAQGLSVGVQDAVNLGWKLAAAINGRAPEGLIDTYHSERHPVGQQLLRNAQASALLYLTGDEMEPLRSVMRELVSYKDAARHLAGMTSGLTIRYDMGQGEHPLLGLRMPPGQELELPDGSRTRVVNLLHAARGVLISTGDSGAAAQTAAAWSDRVDVVTGSWAGAGLDTMPEAVLLRPDGYVAWVAPGGGDLDGALGRWFGAASVAAAGRPLTVPARA